MKKSKPKFFWLVVSYGLLQGKASLLNAPPNGLFHDVVTVIITSQMAFRQLDDEDDND